MPRGGCAAGRASRLVEQPGGVWCAWPFTSSYRKLLLAQTRNADLNCVEACQRLSAGQFQAPEAVTGQTRRVEPDPKTTAMARDRGIRRVLPSRSTAAGTGDDC